MENHKKQLWKIVLFVSIIVFAVSLFFLVKSCNPFQKIENTVADRLGADSDALAETASTEKTSENLPEQPSFLTKAIQENSDTIGWIQLPGSGDSGKYAVINYPIMQSNPEMDEDFYLTHDFEKQRSHDAAIYIQRLNHADFGDPNTVVYGHDLADKTMFTALRQYTDKEFFDEHDIFRIAIPGHVLTYKVYSAFVFDDRHLMYSYNFDDPAEYDDFLAVTLNPAEAKSRKYYVRKGVNVTTEDRIVTLSTCTPNSNDNERFLVVGVLTDDQPTK